MAPQTTEASHDAIYIALQDWMLIIAPVSILVLHLIEERVCWQRFLVYK